MIWFILSLLTLELCYHTCQGFNINNIQKILKRQNDQEVKMVKTQQEVYYYYEEWFCGEVDWEFSGENYMNSYKVVVPEKRYLTETETAAEKYTKECKKPDAIKNGIVKVLYNDFVNKETFVYQIQNTDLTHYLSESSLSEAMSLTLIGFISYLYKNNVKNEMSIIRKQKMGLPHKSITLQEIDDYLKFKKLVKTVMVTFLFIFTKNIKNAE